MGRMDVLPASCSGPEIELRFKFQFMRTKSNQKFCQLSKAQTQISLSSYMLVMHLELNDECIYSLTSSQFI